MLNKEQIIKLVIGSKLNSIHLVCQMIVLDFGTTGIQLSVFNKN